MAAELFVKIKRPGFHCWPEAPEHRAYLRDRHRHMFHIEAWTKVEGDDRELELHDVMDQLDAAWNAIGDSEHDMGRSSCEQMAASLAIRLSAVFPRYPWRVSIAEDGECGATASVPAFAGRHAHDCGPA